MKKNDFNMLKKDIGDLLRNHDIQSKDINEKLSVFLESITDTNQINSYDIIRNWFFNIQKNCSAEVSVINLKDVNSGWKFDDETGNLIHDSGGFFSVIGLDIQTKIREVEGGWRQPIVDQGTESSIIGVIRKNINGVYHYLFEAKFEPGNFNKVLLSPALQVTYSNLNQLHKGKRPRFSEYFVGNDKEYKVIYNHWLPEDGGRFYLKRVKCMIVEVNDSETIDIPDNFKWLTLYQVKQMLKEDNLVNPHVRTILSVL